MRREDAGGVGRCDAVPIAAGAETRITRVSTRAGAEATQRVAVGVVVVGMYDASGGGGGDTGGAGGALVNGACG